VTNIVRILVKGGKTGRDSDFQAGELGLWHHQVMRLMLRLPTIAILAATPLTAVSLFGAGIGSAEPLNCGNGQFWDPINNTCQTPQPAQDCAQGEYWNPLSNVCRPLGQL
jgi:hypothetical protein